MSAPARRRLIVNADDFGLHREINAGVVRAVREGIVTSVSLVPNGTAFAAAVAALRALPHLSVGVHLTLSGERPVLTAEELPTLAPQGELPRHFTVLARKLMLHRIRMDEIERELGAQMDKVMAAGLAVTHIDSHQHAHLWPSLLPLTLRIAARYGIARMRATRRFAPQSGFKTLLIEAFARRGQKRARRHSIRTPDSLAGLAGTGRLNEAALVRLIASLPTGTTELIVHPGSNDRALGEQYRWGFRWEEELAALTSTRVRDAVARHDVQLISYRDL